ncbi:hypothetical protein ABID44_003444 [Aquamicrobium ahrensii]|uniref:Uncharacterized protein n=1 Tax=Aquamicrobium ahrensii TaxID=469551 RepID=A0ABV2KPU8_9HYPH
MRCRTDVLLKRNNDYRQLSVRKESREVIKFTKRMGQHLQNGGGIVKRCLLVFLKRVLMRECTLGEIRLLGSG